MGLVKLYERAEKFEVSFDDMNAIKRIIKPITGKVILEQKMEKIIKTQSGLKVGILTFHDGINYGAFIQAYSLYKYLEAKDVM